SGGCGRGIGRTLRVFWVGRVGSRDESRSRHFLFDHHGAGGYSSSCLVAFPPNPPAASHRAAHRRSPMPRERSTFAGRRKVRLRVERLEDRSVPAVFTPGQIRHAYGFDQITFANGSIVGDGRGQTVAVVDAYDDPFIFSDLRH